MRIIRTPPPPILCVYTDTSKHEQSQLVMYCARPNADASGVVNALLLWRSAVGGRVLNESARPITDCRWSLLVLVTDAPS